MKHRVSGYVIAAGVWHRSLRIDYIHFFYENDYIPISSDYIQGSALIYTVAKDAFRCLFLFLIKLNNPNPRHAKPVVC